MSSYVPVYLWRQHEAIGGIAGWTSLSMAGVAPGTLLGMRVLRWIPERSFRQTVGMLLGLLGVAMVSSGMADR